jgi:hypothetical protein
MDATNKKTMSENKIKAHKLRDEWRGSEGATFMPSDMIEKTISNGTKRYDALTRVEELELKFRAMRYLLNWSVGSYFVLAIALAVHILWG